MRLLKIVSVALLMNLPPARTLQAEEPTEPIQSLPELLEEAGTWMGQNNGPGALGTLDKILARRDEDPAIAAKAQYLRGECLLWTYSRPNEAVTEYEKVMSEHGADAERVNSARVRLLHIYVFAKNWAPVDPLVAEVLADGNSGLARGELVGRALSFKALMHDVLSKEAELAEQPSAVLAHRAAAMENCLQGLDWVETNGCTADLVKHLVHMLCHRHRYFGEEIAADSDQLRQAKTYLALALTSWGGTAVEPKVEGKPLAEWCVLQLQRLGQVAEDSGLLTEALAWNRLAMGHASRGTEDETKAGEAILRLFSKRDEPVQAEQWLRYLNDPVNEPDPLQEAVVTNLGIATATDSAAMVDMSSKHAYWLGRFYQRENLLDDALTLYDQALATAVTPTQRAEALTGLLRTHVRRADQLRALELHSQADEEMSLAEAQVGPAEQAWLQVTRESEPGHAHYAIENILVTHELVDDSTGGRQALLHVLALMDPETAPSKHAFALYKLMEAYAHERRFEQAGDVGADLFQRFAHLDQPDIQELVIPGAVYAVYYYILGRANTKALELINLIEPACSERFGDKLQHYRTVLNSRGY